jgi:hypothetical protein
VTVLPVADNWPGAAGTTLPGGFAVANNKLYILGGFNINVASTNTIYEFDPNAASGSRWHQKTATTPAGIMYAPTASVGGIIYVLGASDYQGGTVVDTNTSFSYNPSTDTIGTVATIPRATGETRALVVNGDIWVMGGGRTAPNPSTEVDVYHVGSNSWTMGPPFTTARRNFSTDSDGQRVWLSGGYDSTGVNPLASMEIYNPPAGCTGTTPTVAPTSPPASPTSPPANTPTSPAATVTAPANTPTSPPAATITPGGPSVTPPAPSATSTSLTPQPSPTSCTLTFTDVPPSQTFYQWIRCLACLGIINGYPDGTFRPNNNVTRGQLSKIASNSAGFNDTPTGQQFQDVPPTGPGSTFYPYIYRLVIRGYINGYPCGGPGEPCIPPNNLPYFRPNTPVTRGQITKIISNAAGFSDPPSGQQFQDVPVGSTFYTYTYRLVTRGVMSGYPCGSPPAGPCVPPDNLPYFRPNNNATRGQTSKIDANTFFPDCNPPRVAVSMLTDVNR